MRANSLVYTPVQYTSLYTIYIHNDFCCSLVPCDRFSAYWYLFCYSAQVRFGCGTASAVFACYRARGGNSSIGCKVKIVPQNQQVLFSAVFSEMVVGSATPLAWIQWLGFYPVSVAAHCIDGGVLVACTMLPVLTH